MDEKKVLGVNIDLRYQKSHDQLIAALAPAFSAVHGDEVVLNLNLNNGQGLVFPDFLALIVAVVKDLQEKGVSILYSLAKIDSDKKADYISRINFFSEVGIDFTESFNRHDGTGRFIEITKFDEDNIYDIVGDTITILQQNCEIEESVLHMLNLCLHEILDNVERHAESPIKGWVVVQAYPFNREVRLMVLDTGVGIYHKLSNAVKKINRCTDSDDALRKCIQREVTSDSSGGFGLYYNAQFAKENFGELCIYSGDRWLQVTNDAELVKKLNYWQGTVVFLKVRTDIKVDHERLFPNKTLKDDFEYHMEVYQQKKSGEEDFLW